MGQHDFTARLVGIVSAERPGFDVGLRLPASAGRYDFTDRLVRIGSVGQTSFDVGLRQPPRRRHLRGTAPPLLHFHDFLVDSAVAL